MQSSPRTSIHGAAKRAGSPLLACRLAAHQGERLLDMRAHDRPPYLVPNVGKLRDVRGTWGPEIE